MDQSFEQLLINSVQHNFSELQYVWIPLGLLMINFIAFYATQTHGMLSYRRLSALATAFAADMVIASSAQESSPPLSFDLLHIKTPQLVGIVIGCLVFFVTIGVVVYLLYMSGSLSKLLVELQSNQPIVLKKNADASPQFSSMPELYDHLITALNTLPLLPAVPVLKGKLVTVRPYVDTSPDRLALFEACSGTALYHESAYDPARIWGWLDTKNAAVTSNDSSTSGEWPSESLTAFDRLYRPGGLANGAHLAVVDNELDRQIGMLSLVDNDPKNLSVRIDHLWITPAFQGKKRSLDALLQVLSWLVSAGYRRVTAEVDERHLIGRKFLESCGFVLEAVLRKHKVVQRRNRNTALYVLLNSEWPEMVELRLKRALGYGLAAPKHKVAEIESLYAPAAAGSGTGGGGGGKGDRKKKRGGGRR